MNAETPTKLLDRTTLWPVWVALALVVGVCVWRGSFILQDRKWQDGEVPAAWASFGFDLGTLVADVPVTGIQQHSLGIDGFKPLTDPPALTPADHGKLRRNKVVNQDRVITVSLGGESRAYPLRIICWHEVVNDTLGGVPIAVTYCSLTDSVRVFDRRLDDEVIELRFSGLLLDSNSLLYDARVRSSDRSLWTQLEGRAISGPAAGRSVRLRTYPASIVPYGTFKELYPGGTVVDGRHVLYKKCYGKRPYDLYVQGGKILYDVDPLPPADSPAPLTPVVVARSGEAEARFFLPELMERTANGPWTTRIGDVPVTIHTSRAPDCAWIISEGDGSELDTWQTYWFADYAFRH